MIPYTQAKGIIFKEISGGGTSLIYQSLEMHKLPSTLEYSVGDLLSFEGMELYAIYTDGTDTYMKDVTDIATPSIAEGTPITEDMSEITFTYTDGKTDSVSYEISVTALPEGYTEKEYIQHSSSGTLNLPAPILQNGYIVCFDMSIPSFQGGGGNLFNLQKQGNDYPIQIRGLYSNSVLKLYAIGTKNTVTLNGINELLSRCIVELDHTNGRLTINDTDYDISTATSSSDMKDTHILLSPVWSSQIWARINIYGIKMLNAENEIIANFIPCSNPSGTVGLYDTINKAFYSSYYWNVAG